MDFEFIRPALLWLLIPALIIFSVLLVRNKKSAPADLIAPHLAQFVMSDNHKKQSQPLWLVAMFTLLAIVFSAGPSFEKKQVPVFQAKNARAFCDKANGEGTYSPGECLRCHINWLFASTGIFRMCVATFLCQARRT